jgi:hypothetical protein
VQNLKKLWAKGRLSSAEIRELADTAQQQGATGMSRISRAGASGLSPQHLFRDLKLIFSFPRGAAPIDWVEIPTLRGPRIQHPVLMPHKFFQQLFLHRRDIWRERIVGGDGALESFWNGVVQSEFVQRHPYLPQEQLVQHGAVGISRRRRGIQCPR